MAKGLISTFSSGIATFDFDQELVHPRSYLTYVRLRDEWIAQLAREIRVQMDEARIEIRTEFNEKLKTLGILPIPEDPELETTH